MSKFVHDDYDDNAAAYDDRAMTIPRRFSLKTAELKIEYGLTIRAAGINSIRTNKMVTILYVSISTNLHTVYIALGAPMAKGSRHLGQKNERWSGSATMLQISQY